MSRSIYRFLLIPALLVLLAGCDRTQIRFNNRMVGTWNIAREKIVIINQDGSVDEVANRTDAGTIEFFQEEFDRFFMQYNITLNYDPFTWREKPVKTDEQNKRMLFYYFYCEEQFECDMIATIETNESDRQIWSFYRSVSNNGQAAHRKTTWTLVAM
ncbi:MAG: hypothetical protein AAFV07_07185 [Bacteroidota bacterium]